MSREARKRRAARSPAIASSIILRIRGSASSSSRASANSVVRFRAPLGLPDGFPLSPFGNGRPRVGLNAPSSLMKDLGFAAASTTIIGSASARDLATFISSRDSADNAKGNGLTLPIQKASRPRAIGGKEPLVRGG